MNWNDNNTKPEKNKPVLVLYNHDIFKNSAVTKELITYTGMYVLEDVLDRHYWMFTSEGCVKYIPVYDIVGWMYVEEFVQSMKLK